MTTFTYKTFTIVLNITSGGEPTAFVVDNCATKILSETKSYTTVEEALDFVNNTVERLVNHQVHIFAARVAERNSSDPCNSL